MDLYNSHLKGYQTNKSQNTRAIAQNKATTNASSRKDSTSTEQEKPLELREGQILRGQVLDHRLNEVTLQLEPGKQTLTARLSGDISLSIGQEAMFTVTGESSGNYVLKYLPGNTPSSEDATIGKALTASGFPMTDRNKAIVAELLANRLPIDKQTLQTLLRVALANQKASPLTLILMYKNNLPLTAANIKQFEAYQNGTHQLLNHVRTISQNLSELLAPATTDEATLGITPANPPVTTALHINQSLIDILYHSTGKSLPDSSTLGDRFHQSQLKQLSNLFEQHGMDNPEFSPELTTELASKIQSGTLSLSTAVTLFSPMLNRNLSQEISPKPSHELQNAYQEEDFSLITKLIQDYDADSNSSSLLSKVLTSQERLIFTQVLKGISDLPNAPILREQILKGNITTKELFSLLKEQLPTLDASTAAKLIQSPEYAKLFEAAFLNKWTIPPKKIGDNSSVINFLKDLTEDLDQLHDLAKDQPGLSGGERLQNPVQNLKENLQFMKDLNQAFPYLQLPVQFKNQDAHTELYVFSKKKPENNKSEPIRVLLHLEMVNLGSLNVYLQMFSNKQLQADFYVENQETKVLIKDHLESLTTALQEKSYHLTATVTDTYHKPDFSKDFIEESTTDSSVKRYTFDIRT